jgi:23S rRNA pseudouridine1911/1915/1917 synthase
MPWRLDRETSGAMLFVKDAALGRDLQRAVAARRVTKTYHAILVGGLADETEVDGAIAKHPDSRVLMRRGVVAEGRPARTRFVPLAGGGGYTLARVEPATGRMHQIRVHAAQIGHAVVGDKIYGPDEELYLEFLRDGFTARLAEQLKMNRQALHCSRVEFPALGHCFEAPMADDMAAFCRDHGLAQS